MLAGLYEYALPVPIALAIALIYYRINPKKFSAYVTKITPKKIKQSLQENNLRLSDFGALYGFVIMFAVTALYIIAGFLANAAVNTDISVTTKISFVELPWTEIISYGVLISTTGLIIIFVALFFNKYFNEKVWQLGEKDRNIGLFSVQYLVETSSKLQSIGSFLFFMSTLVILFVPIVTGKLPQTYWANSIYLVGAIFLLSACFTVSWSILSLTKPHTEVTIRLLQWLKTFENSAKNSMDYLLLPKIIHFCEEEVSEKSGCVKLDLKEYFELLYLARIWGDDSEKQNVSDTIDKLTSSLKENKDRRFVEELCKTKEELSGLLVLNRLKCSTKMLFTKPKRLLSLSSKINIFCVVSALIVAIITLLLPILGIQIH